MKKQIIRAIFGVFVILTGVFSCVKQQLPNAIGLAENRIVEKGLAAQKAPGKIAFSSFLQKLSTSSSDFSSTQFEKEARNFLPDSTFHPGLSLFGVELEYTDSISLVYYEFSSALPLESFAYLGVFSEGGLLLDVLAMKEASFNGNAAAKLIDQQVIELEYYEVYDADGMQQFELVFEYYQIGEKGKLQKLSEPENISIEREYFEASARLLSIEELRHYKTAQLEQMEMELLAEYGQIFSSPKWQNHFEQEYWYTPRHQEVAHLLSGLEQVNLKNIRQLQSPSLTSALF